MSSPTRGKCLFRVLQPQSTIANIGGGSRAKLIVALKSFTTVPVPGGDVRKKEGFIRAVVSEPSRFRTISRLS